MSNKIIISIVIPVYNSENYLSACLDSLLNQGLEEDEYEIILVNDGSKDGSLTICEMYSDICPNITIFSQENQGVSMARNLGLSKAKGIWVMFVDSDDFICKNSLRYLLDHYCNDEFDGIRFWTRIRSDAEIDREMSCEGEVRFIGGGYEFIENFGLDTFCISYLYKRSFLTRNNIHFSPYRIGEDFLFTSQFLLSRPRICSTSSVVYQYLIHPNSATTSRDKVHARRCAYDHLEVNKILINQLNNIKHSLPKVFEKGKETIQGKLLLIFSRILSSDINSKEFRQIIKEQKEIGIIPLSGLEGGIKMSISVLMVNGLAAFPGFYLIVKSLYSKFFTSFVISKLNRDK